MVALFLAGLEVPGKRLILAVILIAVGTAIASYGEVNLNVVGVLCMLASETFEATRLVMTQILLVGQSPVCLLAFITEAQQSTAITLHAMTVTLLAAHASHAFSHPSTKS